MWIDRHIEALRRRRAATRPVVVLTGARQTGKTSLMRRLFPDHAFATFDLRSSPLAGALWETFVCAEIRRAQSNRRGGWDFHFWADRAREADFLLHRAGTFRLADAKWTEHPNGRDAAALRGVARELPPGSVRSLSIFCRAPNAYPLGGGADAVPLDAPDALDDWT